MLLFKQPAMASTLHAEVSYYELCFGTKFSEKYRKQRAKISANISHSHMQQSLKYTDTAIRMTSSFYRILFSPVSMATKSRQV